jgi:hypothetical protein
MRLQRVLTGVAVVAMSSGVTLVSTAPAWAASSKGANPKGAFCQLEKKTQASAESGPEVAATKAMIKGNWPLAQKNLLAAEKSQGKLESKFFSVLSSAPSNVQSAARQLIKQVPALENIVRTSTSVSQFESKEQKFSTGAAYSKAAQTIESYYTSQCGTVTSPTA